MLAVAIGLNFVATGAFGSMETRARLQTGNPLAGKKLYVDPNSTARRQAETLRRAGTHPVWKQIAHGFEAGLANQARDRFQQQPFDALVVDAAGAGKEGLAIFEQILMKAELRGLTCRGILILSQEQADWAERVKSRAGVTVLVRPVTLKQLSEALQELVPPAETDR